MASSIHSATLASSGQWELEQVKQEIIQIKQSRAQAVRDNHDENKVDREYANVTPVTVSNPTCLASADGIKHPLSHISILGTVGSNRRSSRSSKVVPRPFATIMMRTRWIGSTLHLSGIRDP
jgi:hypothetical protein